MIYLLRNKGRRRIKTPAIATLIFLFIIIAVSALAPSFFPRIISSGTIPLWKGGGCLENGVGNFFGFFQTKSSLLKKNDELKQVLVSKQVELLKLEVLKKENNDLRLLLGGRTETNTEMAEVLSKPPRSLYDTIIIEGGEDKGRIAGARVFFKDSALIGEIENVYGKSSSVKLFSSPENTIDGFIGRTAVTITLSGEGGGNLSARLPKGVDIRKNDVIVAPGYGDFIIAKVGSTESSVTDSFQTVRLKSPIGFSGLRFVFVEKP